MNELIETMWNIHSVEYNEMNFDGFKQAIQTACKAQRNACLRIYESNWERQYMTELIKNAEITKEDYE